jgi:hypothetical protein
MITCEALRQGREQIIEREELKELEGWSFGSFITTWALN